MRWKLFGIALVMASAGGADAIQPDEDATANDFQALSYSDANGTMPYRLFVPEGYNAADVGTKYPLVVFLHGAGESGTDNWSQLNLTSPLVILTSKNRSRHPCFMVAPQTTSTWGSGARQGQLNAIITTLLGQYNLDTNRLYITGISLGGNGTWTQASQNPSRYAAVVPVCGWGPTTGLTNVPLWNFHAQNDSTVLIGQSGGSDPNIAALRAAGGNPIYTRYNDGFHNIWDTAYATPGLVEWIMAQRKGQTVSAGPRVLRKHTAIGSSLGVEGTTDPAFSSVTGVAWKNITTSAAGSAAGTSSWSVAGIPLNAGANLVQIVATAGTWSSWGGTTTFSDTSSITKSTSVGDTTPPTLSITTPGAGAKWFTTSQTIDLAGDVTDDTGVASLGWANDRGGSGNVAIGANWAVQGIALQTGANVLTLTATDAAGNSAQDVLHVWSGPNQSPLVRAGTYQTVAHNAAVSCSADVTDDGLPAGGSLTLQWSKVSGPDTVAFGTPTAAVTSATFGAPGTYVLALSANDGAATGTARTTIVVRPDPTTGSTVAAINCGSASSYLASSGINYVADYAYTNGESGATWASESTPLPGTSDPALYRRFRNSPSWVTSFTYSVPVPDGTYYLTLKFVDGSSSFLSQRRFDVSVEGVEVARNLDIWNLVGNTVAMDLVYPVTVQGGLLDISFHRDIGGSILSAILLRTQGGPPVNASPVVSAGTDAFVTLPAAASLSGTVNDDGFSPGSPSPTIAWIKVSGPGTVSFSQPLAVATNVSFGEPGLYVLRLSGSDGIYTSTDDIAVTVYPPVSATGWSHADVGAVGIPGELQQVGGTFSVKGSGASFGANTDQFHFVYQQTIQNDCSITARITGFSGGGSGWEAAYAHGSVMIRESLSTASRQVSMGIRKGVGPHYSSHASPDDGWSTGFGPETPSETAPYWVRLTRAGNVFTGYKSPDGVNWTQVGTTTVNMGSTPYIGFGVCSRDNSARLTATFENVTASGIAVAAPSPTPLEAWRSLQGLPSDGSGDHLTPANDGVPNLLKFAFNMAPAGGMLGTPSREIVAIDGMSGLPRIERGNDGRLRVTYMRRKNCPDISYQVEANERLDSAWGDAEGTISVEFDGTDWERVTYVDDVSEADADARFLRVQVASP